MNKTKSEYSWPDADNPGVPPEPNKTKWHWLGVPTVEEGVSIIETAPVLWLEDKQAWWVPVQNNPQGICMSSADLSKILGYCGACVHPDDLSHVFNRIHTLLDEVSKNPNIAQEAIEEARKVLLDQYGWS